MYLVILGVLIIVANLLGIGPMGNWTWNLTGDLWKFCVPFGLAAIWWVIADVTGMNKRREMAKMEDKRLARRQNNLQALGLDTRRHKKK